MTTSDELVVALKALDEQIHQRVADKRQVEIDIETLRGRRAGVQEQIITAMRAELDEERAR